ncbi:hypothetical protein GGX14DRAFT_577894 [Mycena pura]|uniref:Uncharacterized protein n=1 Tax=Mycena pura TaxID=153505 RepID=A0AAD6UY31_9AGAR|nr:hypothetical protein GGX14DRAFT_577894 [Mycena pura]
MFTVIVHACFRPFDLPYRCHTPFVSLASDESGCIAASLIPCRGACLVACICADSFRGPPSRWRPPLSDAGCSYPRAPAPTHPRVPLTEGTSYDTHRTSAWRTATRTSTDLAVSHTDKGRIRKANRTIRDGSRLGRTSYEAMFLPATCRPGGLAHRHVEGARNTLLIRQQKRHIGRALAPAPPQVLPHDLAMLACRAHRPRARRRPRLRFFHTGGNLALLPHFALDSIRLSFRVFHINNSVPHYEQTPQCIAYFIVAMYASAGFFGSFASHAAALGMGSALVGTFFCCESPYKLSQRQRPFVWAR